MMKNFWIIKEINLHRYYSKRCKGCYAFVDRDDISWPSLCNFGYKIEYDCSYGLTILKEEGCPRPWNLYEWLKCSLFGFNRNLNKKLGCTPGNWIKWLVTGKSK